MHIKAAIRYGLTLVAALVITGSLCFAGAGRFGLGKSTTKSLTVTFTNATKLGNGEVLQAGEYTVKIPAEIVQSPEVEFYAGDKLVAKEQASVEALPQKNGYTSFTMVNEENVDVLTAISPSGLAEKLVFSEPTGQSGS